MHGHGVLTRGTKKRKTKNQIKHTQLLGIVPGMVVYVLPFPWAKRETHKQNSQEFSGKSQDSPGTIPWTFVTIPWNFVYVSVLFKAQLGKPFLGNGPNWFRRIRFETPSSVSCIALTEFRGENSVCSSQPIICVTKQTHRVPRRTHWVCPKTQWGSVSFLLRNSTLETVFHPIPISYEFKSFLFILSPNLFNHFLFFFLDNRHTRPQNRRWKKKKCRKDQHRYLRAQTGT